MVELGLSNRDIATRLRIAIPTVKHHVTQRFDQAWSQYPSGRGGALPVPEIRRDPQEDRGLIEDQSDISSDDLFTTATERRIVKGCSNSPGTMVGDRWRSCSISRMPRAAVHRTVGWE